jgi:hypothetical protein
VSVGQFIQSQDLFVLVDDGSLTRGRYDTIEAAIGMQAKPFPKGVAMLIILPPETKPPPDDIKRAVKALLMRLMSSISCLAYVIEGTGFRGIAVRATLVGMKVFSSRPYPIYVETSLRDAVTKVLPHLVAGQTNMTDVNAVLKQITDNRGLWTAGQPPARGPNGELITKQ